MKSYIHSTNDHATPKSLLLEINFFRHRLRRGNHSQCLVRTLKLLSSGVRCSRFSTSKFIGALSKFWTSMFFDNDIEDPTVMVTCENSSSQVQMMALKRSLSHFVIHFKKPSPSSIERIQANIIQPIRASQMKETILLSPSTMST